MSLVKARVALVVVEVEGELFEVTSGASSVISQAIISAFTARDEERESTEFEEEGAPPGEVKQ